jgi:hypothetical protein
MSISSESEATLKAHDYGQKLCMQTRSMRIILRGFWWSENRGNTADALAFHPAILSNLIDNNGRCAILYILAGRSLGFVSSPHLAGIVTIGATCAVPVSVSENRNIKKLNICFDCLSRSSIQNHWLR